MLNPDPAALIHILAALCVFARQAPAATAVDHPFAGVTHITRTEISPRPETMHIVKIDLTAPGIRFKLTAPGGTLETVRQSTLDFLNQEHAQLAVNSHFFLPFPSRNPEADLIGLAASNGNVYSAFETPAQSYALVPHAPALNIDSSNHAAIVHHDPHFAGGKHVSEGVPLWNAVSGSAQVITNGIKTIPFYQDPAHLDGLLQPGGPRHYSNTYSWYALTAARTLIGLSRDHRTLVLFTVDDGGGSRGMGLEEICDLLVRDYGVHNALNLDGGGSTTLAMQDPATGAGSLVNVPSDSARGRRVGSSLAIFAVAQGESNAETNPAAVPDRPARRR